MIALGVLAFSVLRGPAEIVPVYSGNGDSAGGDSSLPAVTGPTNFTFTLAPPVPASLATSQNAYLDFSFEELASPVSVTILNTTLTTQSVTFDITTEFTLTTTNPIFGVSPISFFTGPITESVAPGVNVFSNLSTADSTGFDGGATPYNAYSSSQYGTPLFSSLPTTSQNIQYTVTPFFGIGTPTPLAGIYYAPSGTASLDLSATWEYQNITEEDETITSPEPRTWAMLLMGVGIFALATRGRVRLS
jgi:hypothetical protein